jgi:hypothetical protein
MACISAAPGCAIVALSALSTVRLPAVVPAEAECAVVVKRVVRQVSKWHHQRQHLTIDVLCASNTSNKYNPMKPCCQ